MRAPMGIVALILAQGLVACDGSSAGLPIAPSATRQLVTSLPSVTQGAAGQEKWTLTGTYIGHVGPEACIAPFSATAAKPVDSVLGIQRSGVSILLMTEHNHYTGTVVADQFIAIETQDPGGIWNCGAERRRFRMEGSVSGRFSADGRTLTGEEVALFRFNSGETISRRWHWTAARQTPAP